MPHTIVYNTQDHYIEMKAWGSLTMEEAREIISKLVWAIKENDCLSILSDYREATMDLSVAEIYGIPQKISDLASSLDLSDHKIKRALVAQKDSKNFSFFETVAVNRGQPIKLFFDMEDARKWLLEK